MTRKLSVYVLVWRKNSPITVVLNFEVRMYEVLVPDLVSYFERMLITRPFLVARVSLFFTFLLL